MATMANVDEWNSPVRANKCYVGILEFIVVFHTFDFVVVINSHLIKFCTNKYWWNWIFLKFVKRVYAEKYVV